MRRLFLLLLALPGAARGDLDGDLITAVHKNQPAMVRQYLGKGANPNVNTEPSLLSMASAAGHLEVVQLLLKAGAKLEVRDDKTRTALIHAAQGGDAEVVRTLLAAGANANARIDLPREYFRIHGSSPHTRSENQRSALMLAARRGDMQIVGMLVAAGAKVNAKSYYGETALMLAAEGGHADTVRWLLDNGADLHANAKDMAEYQRKMGNGGGGTALVYALRDRHIPAAKTLLAEYAKRRAVVEEPDVVLLYALIASDLDSVKSLVALGVDASKPAPLEWATAYSSPEVIAFVAGQSKGAAARK